tara:strand:+ start:887 stop:1243 length:357 start_codon:yes stop_codon:yes gene_type:complete
MKEDKELIELIEKLNRVEWETFDKYTMKAIGNSNGNVIELRVKYSLNNFLHIENHSAFVASIIISVDGIQAMRWDLQMTEEQKIVSKWFTEKYYEVSQKSYREQDAKLNLAAEIFKSI